MEEGEQVIGMGETRQEASGHLGGQEGKDMSNKGKSWLVWVVVGVVLMNVVGAWWLFLRGQESGEEQGEKVAPLVTQTEEERELLDEAGVRDEVVETRVAPTLEMEALREQFEPIVWTIVAVDEQELVLKGKRAGEMERELRLLPGMVEKVFRGEEEIRSSPDAPAYQEGDRVQVKFIGDGTFYTVWLAIL